MPEGLGGLGGRPTAGAAGGGELRYRHPGVVDLHSPFFREMERKYNLPSGVLSALAEQESHGRVMARPISRRTGRELTSAGGLYQILRGRGGKPSTAAEWGLSPEEVFDPRKATEATARVLARRARRVGIQRAIGMHYGGEKAAWAVPTGPSGESPASYTRKVLRRVGRYRGESESAVAGGGDAEPGGDTAGSGGVGPLSAADRDLNVFVHVDPSFPGNVGTHGAPGVLVRRVG